MTHRSHSIRLLTPYPASVPPTIPAKRPADTPAEQRSPGPKIAKPPSQVASPALAAAKKPAPQSSPLVPPSAALPPSLSSPALPALNSSPPKHPPREAPDPIIDLTQPTPELAPAAVQNRTQPSQPNQAPVLPNLAQAQPIQPPTQSQPPTTPQSQLQSSMQSQPTTVSVMQLASHDVADMQAKLQQVEMRIKDTHKRQMEAMQAGNNDEANSQRIALSRQVAAYKKGRMYVEQVLSAKKLVAATQAQGSSQPHDAMLNPGTSQHSTPAVPVTPQATPTNSHSTPRLATPRNPGMPLNQNPMSAMNQTPPNIHPNSSASAAANTNANAALLQAFNTNPTQTPPQVSSGGVSAHDPHVLGATPHHGHSHNNSLGKLPQQMPPGVAAQMKQFNEQRGVAQGNQGLVIGGDGSGTNAGGIGGQQWSGTLTWQGTDTTRNERKEVHAQVTAITSNASKSDP